MNATEAVAPPQAEADLDAFLADVFDRPALSAHEFADRIGVSHQTVKDAYRSGDLAVVRVSPRRIVVSRSTARRWLLAQIDAAAKNGGQR